LIPFRIAAQRRDIERRVVEEVFQLARQFRTIFRPICRSHASQVKIVERLRIIARMASFQKLVNGFLWSIPAQRVFRFGRRLRLQRGHKDDDG
jgi:hypothetical protein